MVGFGARALIAQAMEASGAPVVEEEMPPLVENLPGALPRAHRRRQPAVSGRDRDLGALKADGARLAVLTNKPQELTDPLLPLLGLGGMVRRRLWCGEEALYQARSAHLP